MTKKELYNYVDHTALKPYTTWEEIQTLCEEAIQYHTASVCIPSCYVGKVKSMYGEQLRICTVVGFPLGYANTAAKIAETKAAIMDGAVEIDMVINICDVKNGDYQKVEDEIRMLKEATGDHILKVIIETCLLTENEKITMCDIVTRSGADYIKTSTGFSTGGATFDDIKLFSEHIGSNVNMKAAGGISSLDDAERFISLGCDRLGTSRIVKLAKGLDASGY